VEDMKFTSCRLQLLIGLTEISAKSQNQGEPPVGGVRISGIRQSLVLELLILKQGQDMIS